MWLEILIRLCALVLIGIGITYVTVGATFSEDHPFNDKEK